MASSVSGPMTIDKIDAKILRVLQKDGRISNLKLAEEVHLSPTAVLERVKRLTRDGFILGYEAKLNPAKLGAIRELILALDKARVVAVPVNWRLTAPEVATVVGEKTA